MFRQKLQIETEVASPPKSSCKRLPLCKLDDFVAALAPIYGGLQLELRKEEICGGVPISLPQPCGTLIGFALVACATPT